MGRELAAAYPSAREVFEEVDEALKQKLSRLIFEGPEAELLLTENAQPALMAVSMAAIRALEREVGFDIQGGAVLAAGHSLGEYSALCATRAFSIADAARLLRRRGLAMQEAVPVGQGAMAALLGLDLAAANAVAADAAQGEICSAANDNAPGQVVVSGHRSAVERAVKLAAERGARRSVILAVSAPFHCALMMPAAEVMAKALNAGVVGSPILPVVSNVTATAVADPETIRRLLVEQVTSMVRWRESIVFMKGQGVDTLIEVGAGRVLSGLARRIDPELATVSIQSPADLDAFAKTL